MHLDRGGYQNIGGIKVERGNIENRKVQACSGVTGIGNEGAREGLTKMNYV